MPTGSEQHLANVLRYYGMGLQLAGVLTAALGISAVRREWTERLGIVGTSTSLVARLSRSISAAGRRSVRRFATWIGRPQDVRILGNVATEFSLAWSGTGTVTIGPPPAGGSVEERLAWLEQHVLAAFEHAETTRRRVSEEASARAAAIAAEQAARNESAEQVRRSIGRLASGGLRLQAWGVCALLLGIVLATIPEKLAAL